MAPRFPLLVLAASAVLLATGCRSFGGCSNPDTYSAAQDLPRLKIPAGLDGLDTSRALEIPELAQPVAPPDPQDSCLEEPPEMREPGSVSIPIVEEPARESTQEPARRRRPVSPPR